jgi:hypothetical protein
MSAVSRIVLEPIHALYVEMHNLKGKMARTMEFLSFDGEVLHQVAGHIIGRESTSLLSTLRLVYVRDEKRDDRVIWYDVNVEPITSLPAYSRFRRSSEFSTIGAVNDELRRGYGFSTHDAPVEPDLLHALRMCLPGMPKIHSVWVRDEKRYLLFKNGVLARRC